MIVIVFCVHVGTGKSTDNNPVWLLGDDLGYHDNYDLLYLAPDTCSLVALTKVSHIAHPPSHTHTHTCTPSPPPPPPPTHTHTHTYIQDRLRIDYFALLYPSEQDETLSNFSLPVEFIQVKSIGLDMVFIAAHDGEVLCVLHMMNLKTTCVWMHRLLLDYSLL